MKKLTITLAAATALGLLASAQTGAQEALATGLLAGEYDPSDLVTSRQALKAQMESIQEDMEFYLESATEDDLFTLENTMETVAATLEVFPYLLPSSTSPQALSAAGSDTTTDAAPEIWDDFESFFAMAKATADLAHQAAQAEDIETFKTASADVWEACEACHATYLDYHLPSF